MSLFAVKRKSDGVEVYQYSYEEPLDLESFPFSTHDHVIVDETPVVHVQSKPIRITKLAFRNRFTPSEKVAVELAALDSVTDSMPKRMLAATLRANQADVAVAEFIDISTDSPAGLRARSGVLALESFGIIPQGRASVILDTPPTEDEVWNG